MIQQVSSGAQELIFLISSPGMLLLLIPVRPVGSDFPFADLVLRVARSGKRIAGGGRDAEHGTHPSGPVPCFSFGVAGGRIHQSRGTWWQGPTPLSGVHKSIFPSKSEAIEDNKWEGQCPNKTLFRKTDGESDVDPGP